MTYKHLIVKNRSTSLGKGSRAFELSFFFVNFSTANPEHILDFQNFENDHVEQTNPEYIWFRIWEWKERIEIEK